MLMMDGSKITQAYYGHQVLTEAEQAEVGLHPFSAWDYCCLGHLHTAVPDTRLCGKVTEHYHCVVGCNIHTTIEDDKEAEYNTQTSETDKSADFKIHTASETNKSAGYNIHKTIDAE